MEAVRGIICTQVRKGILGQVGNARSQKGRWVGPRYLTFDCPEESPYFRVEARERKRPRHGALLDCDHKLAPPPFVRWDGYSLHRNPSRIVFFGVTRTFGVAGPPTGQSDSLSSSGSHRNGQPHPRAHVARLRFEATRTIGPRSLPIDLANGCDLGIEVGSRGSQLRLSLSTNETSRKGS